MATVGDGWVVGVGWTLVGWRVLDGEGGGGGNLEAALLFLTNAQLPHPV